MKHILRLAGSAPGALHWMTMDKEPRDKNDAFFARVGGRVQGVGFRYSAIREAHRLGVRGWVRNTANGDVEVWAEGEPDKLDAFLEWLRKGPQFARVDSFDVRKQACKDYRDFIVEY